MNNDEYREYVDMLARNGLDAGESPRTIANIAVATTMDVGTERTVVFGAEPFVDDPATQTRLWPKDVILAADRDIPRSVDPNNLRKIAVEILKRDVHKCMMGIENDTARPWGEA